MIRVGPAGWDYDDWWGIVYPKPTPRGFDPLAYLAGYYDTVEINSTFYRPMPQAVARTWCRRVADRPAFRFTAKLWRRFTHERDTAFTAEEVRQARETPEALAAEGRLGALLLQFPWSFKNEDVSREWLVDVLNAFHGLPLVLEVRHASWNTPRTYEDLAERGVGFVNIDQPLFGKSIRPSAIATGPIGYIRVHGRNYHDWFRKDAGRDARYDYLYDAGELQPWAARAEALEKGGRAEQIYVVTNNHFEGKAVANATMLESMLRNERVDAPPDLVRRYEDVLAPFAAAATHPAPEPRR